MFDYYGYKKYMEELAKKNEVVRTQLRVQQENKERERLLWEEKQQEVHVVRELHL